MQNAKPDTDLRPHRTLGYVANRGGVLVRLALGGNADPPTKLQWSDAAVDRGFDDALHQGVQPEL
eukprot:5516501-Pyramimonas_sp.AAC.1